MKRILILGGKGYVGAALTRFLLSDGHEVKTIDTEWFGDHDGHKNHIKKDYASLTQSELYDYDVIILLAAHSSVKMCERNLSSCFKNNVVNFVNLIQQIWPWQTFIYASSSSVYSGTQEDTEDSRTYIPHNYYDLSKAEIDNYAQLSNVNYYGLRFGTVAGPSPNLRNEIMINAMVDSYKKTGKIEVFNGHVNRPVLGIFDLGYAITRIIHQSEPEYRGIYNLASFNMTVDEIGERVAQTLSGELIKGEPRGKPYDFKISTKKFESVFNFEFRDTVERLTIYLAGHWDSFYKGDRNKKILYGV